MHEQITDLCQGLDIFLDLTKFFSVDENLQREDNHESPREWNGCNQPTFCI